MISGNLRTQLIELFPVDERQINFVLFFHNNIHRSQIVHIGAGNQINILTRENM